MLLLKADAAHFVRCAVLRHCVWQGLRKTNISLSPRPPTHSRYIQCFWILILLTGCTTERVMWDATWFVAMFISSLSTLSLLCGGQCSLVQVHLFPLRGDAHLSIQHTCITCANWYNYIYIYINYGLLYYYINYSFIQVKCDMHSMNANSCVVVVYGRARVWWVLWATYGCRVSILQL